MTKETLTRLIKEAADAHHVYEQSLGHKDENWPVWYAEYILEHSQV